MRRLRLRSSHGQVRDWDPGASVSGAQWQSPSFPVEGWYDGNSTETLTEDKQRQPPPRSHTPVLQGLCLELETELSRFVSFWYKACCCFPGGHVRTTALMLIAKNCPAGRKQRASCHLPDPLEERVLFTAQKVPPERSALFFSITVTLATCKFSGYCSWCWIWGNLPLCWERERETQLSQSWLSVCVRRAQVPPLLSWEKRKQMLTATPWEFTLLCCKILHY